MDNDVFSLDIRDHVAWFTLDNAQRRNAMGFSFFSGLSRHFKELDDNPDVRVVVVKAQGKSFTAGLDLVDCSSLLNGGTGADARETMRRKVIEFQDAMSAVEQCRKPVIAAVHGHCVGGGIDLITACDVRMCSADVLFSIRQTRIAVVPDLGTLQRLPHIIGHGWFRDLALTGRDFSADLAEKIGLVTHVLPDQEALLDKAAEIASEIAALPPLAVQGAKDVINFSRDNGVYPGLQYVAQKNAAALPSEDLMEAVAAFSQKRPGKFQGK